MTERIPPQNLEAEMAILGAMMADDHLVRLVGDTITPEDMYAHVHGDIYTAIRSVVSRGGRADMIAVADDLRRRGKLESAGGASYLSACIETIQTTESAQYYAKLIREKSLLRDLIGAAPKIHRLGFEEEDAEHSIREAERLIREISQRGVKVDDGVSAERACYEVFTQLSRDHQSSDVQRTPWPTLNELTGGFFPEEMIGWVSAPKMGKSGVMLDLAEYTAMHYGPVALYSLEMPVQATTRRLLAMFSGISARRQREGALRDYEWDIYSDAMTEVAKRKIRMYGRPRTLADMRSNLARMEERPVAVIVDHVGFLGDSKPRKGESRVDALERVYFDLLDIAAEHHVVMHAVQHVNRFGQEHDRDGAMKRPTLDQIRGGGNLEGNAHAVIFPFRPWPHDPAKGREASLIIGANRDGEAGEVSCTYLGQRNLWLENGQDRPWFETAEAAPASVIPEYIREDEYEAV